MAPLAVDPAALDSAGGAVVAAGAGLGAVISSLTAALAGCAGMAGDDPAGAVFGRSYDGSAAALVQAMSVARNGLCNLGDGVRMSAHNYSLAEAMSDVAGRGGAGGGAPPPHPVRPDRQHPGGRRLLQHELADQDLPRADTGLSPGQIPVRSLIPSEKIGI